MKEGYDLIVVGAGPAGLMAAKTAAEHNLKVALVERRKDISKWTRADCMMFYGLEGGFLGEDIHVEVGKIIFPRNGFSVNYRGGLYPLYNWRVLSPRGHRIDFTSEQPIAALFDKGILLRGLLGEVEKLGVTVLTGTLALEAENTHKGAKVLIKDQGEKHWLEARKVIAADGINSRITESIGLNKERLLMGRFKVVQYIMEGVHNPYPNSWIQFYGQSLSPFAPLHFLQTVSGERLQKLGAIRPEPGNPEDDLKQFIKTGPYAPWFSQASIMYKMGITVKAFMPLERPVAGNLLAIGDAAALFLNPEIQRISQGYAINPYYEDEEIDYLFSLVEGEVFPGSINQYKIPKMLWDAIFKHRERITREKPELSQKIGEVHKMTLQDAFTIEQEE
jgi:flavin-dependent dehydrogenase